VSEERRRDGAVHCAEVARSGYIANRMNAVGVDCILEFLLNQIEGFGPFDFFEFAGSLVASSQQGLSKTVGVFRHESASYASGASRTIVEFGRFDFGDFAVDDICLQVVVLALRRTG